MTKKGTKEFGTKKDFVPATKLNWWEKPSVLYGKNALSSEESVILLNGENDSQTLISQQQSVNKPRRRKKIKRKKIKKINWTIQRINSSEILESDILELGEGYVQPLIDCCFNLPRVSAQLERLMGTNVVHLTDKKYMMELRKRIHEDFNDMLTKRIEKREFLEGEREKNLILKGCYTAENCPPRLIIAHSIALAKEMERQRKLLMAGKTIKCPSELAKHPVFMMNQKTNNIIAKRRSKLKTIREINAQRLLRQGAKWEKERLVHERLNREKDLEMKQKHRAEKQLEDEYMRANQKRGTNLLRIKNRDYADCELDLQLFLEKHGLIPIGNLLDLHRGGDKKKEPDKIPPPISSTLVETVTHENGSDEEVDDEQEVTVQNTEEGDESDAELTEKIESKSDTNRQIVEKTTDDLKDTSNSTEDVLESVRGDSSSEILVSVQKITDYDHTIQMDAHKQALINQNYMLEKSDFQKLHYEDPKIQQLRQTETVENMYSLAEEIISGASNIGGEVFGTMATVQMRKKNK